MSAQPFRPSEGPDADPIAGLDTWPRYGNRIRDLEHLFAQARFVLEAPVQPSSYPQGVNGHKADAGFVELEYLIDRAFVGLGHLADLAPPAGSAVTFARRGTP